MRRFIIDSDTGSDDAAAIVMALKHPEVQVDAITVVAGNVPLEMALQNALYTVELCGSTTPVYAGRAAPLMRTLTYSYHVHGRDGMGDIGLPLTGRTPAPGHAVDVLVEQINAAPGEITLVTLGPLSNIAVALLRDPSLAEKVVHCYIMGGTSDNHGNVTPSAEFNIWADPEAARIVFDSGMPITLIGWDVSRLYAVFTPEQAAALRAYGTPEAAFCVDIQATLMQFCLTETKLGGFDFADPIAMGVALDPAIASETISAPVVIVVDDGPTRGMTMIDHHNKLKRPHSAVVVLAADRARFDALLELVLSEPVGV